jgi:hypothetical protein
VNGAGVHRQGWEQHFPLVNAHRRPNVKFALTVQPQQNTQCLLVKQKLRANLQLHFLVDEHIGADPDEFRQLIELSV